MTDSPFDDHTSLFWIKEVYRALLGIIVNASGVTCYPVKASQRLGNLCSSVACNDGRLT